MLFVIREHSFHLLRHRYSLIQSLFNSFVLMIKQIPSCAVLLHYFIVPLFIEPFQINSDCFRLFSNCFQTVSNCFRLFQTVFKTLIYKSYTIVVKHFKHFDHFKHYQTVQEISNISNILNTKIAYILWNIQLKFWRLIR
jgi:hypothetical protein